MKLLITGGAGFIGSNFVHYWLATHPDDQLIVLDKLTYSGRRENLVGALEKIEFIEGDIVDPEVVFRACEGVDAIVHFAAEAHVDHSILTPGQFVQTNVVGTFNLLEAARKDNIRFHHVSTDEVLGQLPLEGSVPWTESSPYNPRSPYSATKAASDHLVRSYYYTYGLPITISNCANNIGPFMIPERLLPRAICRLISGMTVPIYTPGNQVREWLDVDDHCSAIDLIIQNGKIGETYFIGPDNPEMSNLEVIKLLMKIMEVSEDKIEFISDRPGHDQKYALDHTKITSELGWQPKYDLPTSLVRLVDWYKANPDWWQPVFKDSEEFFIILKNKS